VAIGTVKKIVQREGLRSKLSPKRKNPKRETAVSKNLLTEEGDPSRPNQAWSGDFTYIWTREGWLYLASVMDLYSRRIVGWAFGKQATKELVIGVLEMGVKHRKPVPGLVFHSDKGSQYTSYAFKDALERHQLRQSHAGTGNCFEAGRPHGVPSCPRQMRRKNDSTAVSRANTWTILSDSPATRPSEKSLPTLRCSTTRADRPGGCRFVQDKRIHTVLGNLSPLEFERRTHPAQPMMLKAA